MTTARTVDRPAAQSSATRIEWIDRLRIWLTILVVAHHSADTYSSLGDWYVAFGGKDASATGLTLFMIANQLYFMGAFFLLAGFFTPAAFDRRGPRRYLRDRLVRLGIPLLFYVVVIRPLCLLPGGIVKAQQANASHQHFSLPRYLALGGDPGVTWFLEVLIVFSLGYVLLRVLTRTSTAHAQIPSTTPRIGGLGVIVVALAAITMVWQWAVPLGAYWPIVGLPSPYFLPQYLLFFILGAVASRRQWLQQMPSWWGYPAIATTLTGGILFGLSLGKSINPSHLGASAEQAGGMALFSVSFTTLLIIVFRRWFAQPVKTPTRLLASNSFLVYVIHPFTLTWIAVLLMGLNWPSIAWAGLLFLIAAPTTWALASLLRRNPTIRRVI